MPFEDNFRSRKEVRTKYYFTYIHCWKKIPCAACNGSGRYDSFNNPACGACEGEGKVRVPPKQYEEWKKMQKIIRGW